MPCDHALGRAIARRGIRCSGTPPRCRAARCAGPSGKRSACRESNSCGASLAHAGDQRLTILGEQWRPSLSRVRCIALLCAFTLRHRLQLKNTRERCSFCDPACFQCEAYGIQFAGVGHAQVGRPPGFVIHQINFHFSCKSTFMDQLDLLFAVMDAPFA